MPDPMAVQLAIDGIEAELKAQDWWSAEEPSPKIFENMGPFGQNTMALPQWLQFIFVPRVRGAIASGEFPPASQVGAYAVRELDGDHNASHLVSLLCEFDALFNRP